MPEYSQFRILVDLPSRHPGLGFVDTARGLASLIHQSEPQFAIAVFGPWGSGKTTLMHAIEQQLDTSRTIAVEFSAWRYEREEHLIVPLLDTIREALVSWSVGKGADPQHAEPPSRAREAAKKTAKTVGAVMASVLAGISFKIGIPGALDLSYDANKALAAAQSTGAVARPRPGKSDQPGRTFAKRLADPTLPQSFYHACFAALARAFKEFEEASGGVRFVVFVDDLDRCLPSGTLDVLESMKLFFDLRGFVFVVGLDRDVVERCIDIKYTPQGQGPGTHGADSPESQAQLIHVADYLKKIFQVPFSLAPVSVGLLDDLFWALQQDSGLPAEQVNDLNQTVRPHLAFLFSGMRLNPREVKRFINAYAIQMKVKPWLDPQVVLALNTLGFRPDCERIYTALATFRVEFTVALRGCLAGDRGALDDFDLGPSDLPDDIRDYLLAGPGQALLDTEALDEHLDAGEATRSSSGGYVLEVLRSYREFRLAINRVLDPRSDPALVPDHQSAAQQAIEQMDRMLNSESSDMEVFGRVREWLAGKERASAWNRYQDALQSPDQRDSVDQARRDAQEEAKERAQTVLAEIRRLRRRAQLDHAYA